MRMNKEDLKRNQPVAYQVLSNALKNQKLSHAYLFYGPSGSPKEQMALLLVQSLFCQHTDEDGFACQECESCRRIAREESLDFFWAHAGGNQGIRNLSRNELKKYWDGEDIEVTQKQKDAFRIKKDTILSLQEKFSKSSVEKGWQAYILEEYDSATPEASNALLKFLEEPKDGLAGILIADELFNILPTILSRAQLISFRPASLETIKSSLSKVIEDEESIDMLARSGWSLEDLTKRLENGFFEIKEAAKTYYENRTRNSAILDMQLNVFNSKSEYYSKENVQLFIQWILYLAKKDIEENPRESMDIRLLCLNALDELKRPVDMALLLDSLYYSIQKTGYQHRLQ